LPLVGNKLKLPQLFSARTKKVRESKQVKIDWVCGFINAEGSFHFSELRTTKVDGGQRFHKSFRIVQYSNTAGEYKLMVNFLPSKQTFLVRIRVSAKR
jgi:hypothetical protein